MSYVIGDCLSGASCMISSYSFCCLSGLLAKQYSCPTIDGTVWKTNTASVLCISKYSSQIKVGLTKYHCEIGVVCMAVRLMMRLVVICLSGVKKSSPISIIGRNFVKRQPIFKIPTQMESVQHLQQISCNTSRHS